MPNEQACDGSRPACDAAMTQLAAAQARADESSDALLDMQDDLSRYQAQSAENERVYERELKRAEAAEKQLHEMTEIHHHLGTTYVEHMKAATARADALAQQVADSSQQVAELRDLIYASNFLTPSVPVDGCVCSQCQVKRALARLDAPAVPASTTVAALDAENATMRQLLHDLTEDETAGLDTFYGVNRCVYCGVRDAHAPDCPIVRGRALVDAHDAHHD